MIQIKVITYSGAPPPQPLLAQFDELGGNIGRAEGNALVLRDPARTISRTHAAISFRDGVYHIRNLGTAIPVYVNGQPLDNGRDMAVAVGDEIRIDGYTMKVLSGEISSPRFGQPYSFPHRLHQLRIHWRSLMVALSVIPLMICWLLLYSRVRTHGHRR